jgi:hypothetical protein
MRRPASVLLTIHDDWAEPGEPLWFFGPDPGLVFGG